MAPSHSTFLRFPGCKPSWSRWRQPVWKDAQLGNGWTKVGLEQIAAWDPDQIYTIAYFNNPNDVVEKLKADLQLQKVNAVKHGRLYAFPGDYYSWDQPDTRWILGLNWLASKMHPEPFPDLNINSVCWRPGLESTRQR